MDHDTTRTTAPIRPVHRRATAFLRSDGPLLAGALAFAIASIVVYAIVVSLGIR